MALIDQQEAAKQIRGNKEYVADCEWLKGYNKACEDNAQIVEQMKGQEIIRCKDCDWWTKQEASLQGRCALSGTYPTGAFFCGNARQRPYPCDPEKNQDCSKTGCYINGGECRHTLNREYAREEDE